MELQEGISDPVAFHAEMMGDIMYFYQAIKQHNAPDFIKAVLKEFEAHNKSNHWTIVKRERVSHQTLTSCQQYGL